MTLSASVDAAPTRTTPPKPPRNALTRAPSDPTNSVSTSTSTSSSSTSTPCTHRDNNPHPQQQHPNHHHHHPHHQHHQQVASQQIYVLSADGSSLFLLDPSKPPDEEEPPAYHSIQLSPRRAGAGVSAGDGGRTLDGEVNEDERVPGDAGSQEELVDAEIQDDTVSVREGIRVRASSRTSHRSGRTSRGILSLGSSASLIIHSSSAAAAAGDEVWERHVANHPGARAQHGHGHGHGHGHRQRASTTSAVRPPSLRDSDHPTQAQVRTQGRGQGQVQGHRDRTNGATITSSASSSSLTSPYPYSGGGGAVMVSSSSRTRTRSQGGTTRVARSSFPVHHSVSVSLSGSSSNPNPPQRPRTMHHSSSSPPYTLRTVRIRAPSSASMGAPRANLFHDHANWYDNENETTPLLRAISNPVGQVDRAGAVIGVRRGGGRGLWKEVFCGKLEVGEESGKWKNGWKRYWRPVGQGEYWRAVLHLLLLNFPFALFVWPPLLVGTLAGTALLITLPIGAAVWWLTLIIARSAARLEITMQTHHHSPLPSFAPAPIYHPIFHRIKVDEFRVAEYVHRPLSSAAAHSAPTSPISTSHPALSIYGSTGNIGNVDADGDGDYGDEVAYPLEQGDIEWEKRFIKCSYAMFCDHYSYSALSYFLLIKPIITLFSTIALVALFPVAVATVGGLPVYLRAARRWGRWQAGVAMENL